MPHSAAIRARRTRRVLGQGRAQLLDPLARGRDRDEVRLGEVAVVLGLLLDAARGGQPGVLVPVPGLLDDRAARGEQRRPAGRSRSAPPARPSAASSRSSSPSGCRTGLAGSGAATG